MTIIRESTREDKFAIGEVCRQAFGREDEGRLVVALREGGCTHLSLVAEIAGEVVGFILFSELAVITETDVLGGLSLAPLAVLPADQRRGIGSMLVEHGLRLGREAGHPFVVVLGEPEFYTRFGFSSQCARLLKSPYAGPNLMAIELKVGTLDGVEGEVVYPPPFDRF